jgi:hypothetical protein
MKQTPSFKTRSTKSTLALVILLLFTVSVQHVCHGFLYCPSSKATTTTVIPAFQRSSRVRREVVDPQKHFSLDSMVDPSLEAESLTIMAHVVMDFSGFVMSPSRSLLRLFAVLGRIFSISADYVADHSIRTDELLIQLFLISVVLKDWLFDGSTPTAGANNTVETK